MNDSLLNRPKRAAQPLHAELAEPASATAPGLRTALSTLGPVFALASASAAAASMITAYAMSAAHQAEVLNLQQALRAAYARTQVLEVLALNAGALSAPSGQAAQTAASAAPAPAPAPVATPQPKPVVPQSNPAPQPAVQQPAKTAPRAQAAAPAPAPTPAAPVKALVPPYSAPVQADATGAGAQGAAESVAAPSRAGAAPAAAEIAAPAPPAAPPAAAQAATGTATRAGSPAAGADRIVMVPGAQIGVARIEPGAVVMLSGKRVRTGEMFESGEVLREADPARNRIVTDQRSVVLLP